MRRLFSRARAGRGRGQSLAEFALILPVLILIVLIALDFGRALYGWVTLQNATRIAANYAALYPEGWKGAGEPAVQADYETLTEYDLDTANCTAPGTPPAPVFTDGPDTAVGGGSADTAFDIGDTVVVELSCTFSPLTPIISGIVGTNVQLSARSEFRIRAGDIVGLANPTPIILPVPGTPTPTPTLGPTPTPTTAPCAAPTAEFSGTPLSGAGGSLSVSFTSASTIPGGCTATYLWNFGDGQTSTLQNPTHLYTKPPGNPPTARYTVSLTVTTSAGDTETKNNYVQVSN
jgi:PKD repeat protein